MNTSASPSRLLSRRQALGQLGGIAALGLAPGLSTVVSSARAATTGSYRALVCVFLYGGNDANNLIVPTDSAGYDLYRTSRGGTVGTPSNGALALPPAGEAGGVLPLVGTHFGVHPSMPELAGLWNSGNAAVLFNVGNLVQPFPSAAAFLANRNASLIPVNLYSHSDQQQQMQVTSLPLITRTGWAGRLIDAMSASGTTLPPGISAAGNALLLQGTQSMPTVVPAKGTLALNGFGSGVPSAARRSALQALLGSGSDSTLVQALGRIGSHSVEVASLLKPVLSPAAAAKFSANFANYATSSL